MPPLLPKFIVNATKFNAARSLLSRNLRSFSLQQSSSWSSIGASTRRQLTNLNALKTPLIVLSGLTVGALAIFSENSGVKAAQILEKDVEIEGTEKKVKSKRLKYNFIAETVEQTAPAVVFIEVVRPLIGPLSGIAGGSGFIIHPNGLIVTNAHVVANAQACTVTLADATKVSGRVEALDEKADLATIRIDPFANMPYIKLANSDEAMAGEFVIALGSPLSLTNSITSGIISSVARDLRSVGHASPIEYIQTDTAINQGNSGGPLVNLDGEAVGINSMKAGEGIAFAIPSNVCKQFLAHVERAKAEQSRSSRNSGGWFGSSDAKDRPLVSPLPGTQRRYLGVTLLTLNRDIINGMKRHHRDFPNVEHGVIVMKVVAGSPSHEAGLQPLDVIVGVNGRKLFNTSTIFQVLESPETTIVLDIRRNNQTLRITVDLPPPASD